MEEGIRTKANFIPSLTDTFAECRLHSLAPGQERSGPSTWEQALLLGLVSSRSCVVVKCLRMLWQWKEELSDSALRSRAWMGEVGTPARRHI